MVLDRLIPSFFKTANGNPLKHKKPHKKTQQNRNRRTHPKRGGTHTSHKEGKTKDTQREQNTQTPTHKNTNTHTHKQQAPKDTHTLTTTHKPQTKPHTPPPNHIPRTPRARGTPRRAAKASRRARRARTQSGASGRTCSHVTSGGAHHAPSGLGLVRLVGPLGPSAASTVCGRPPREPDAPARASVRRAQNPLSLTLLPPVPLPQSGVPPHRRRGE